MLIKPCNHCPKFKECVKRKEILKSLRSIKVNDVVPTSLTIRCIEFNRLFKIEEIVKVLWFDREQYNLDSGIQEDFTIFQPSQKDYITEYTGEVKQYSKRNGYIVVWIYDLERYVNYRANTIIKMEKYNENN